MQGEGAPGEQGHRHSCHSHDVDAVGSLRVAFKGGRYEVSGFPVDALTELPRFERLILDVAKQLWRRENPGRERVPRGFTDGFKMRLTGIQSGSVVPVLTTEDSLEEGLFEFEEGQSYLDRAVFAFEELLRSTSESNRIPEDFPREALTHFGRFGSTLRDDELIEFSSPDSEVARLTPVTRKRLIEHSSTQYMLQDDVLVGEISEVDAGRLQFELRKRDGELITGSFKEESLVQDLRAVVGVTGTVPLVRLQCLLKTPLMRLEKPEIEDLYSVEVLFLPDHEDSARLTHLATLSHGWYDNEQGEPIPTDVLEMARDAMDPLRALGVGEPLLYPTLEGGVQIEWSYLGITREVEIDSDLTMGVCEYNEATRESRESTVGTLQEMRTFFEGEQRSE